MVRNFPSPLIASETGIATAFLQYSPDGGLRNGPSMRPRSRSRTKFSPILLRASLLRREGTQDRLPGGKTTPKRKPKNRPSRTRDLCFGSKPYESSSKREKFIADLARTRRAKSIGEIRQGPKEPGLQTSTADPPTFRRLTPSKITHLIRRTRQTRLSRKHKEIT